MIVLGVMVVGLSSGGEESWEDVVVLRVVDEGIAMVIGSTVGVVLVPGGDYGGRCDGDSGVGGGSGSWSG